MDERSESPKKLNQCKIKTVMVFLSMKIENTSQIAMHVG